MNAGAFNVVPEVSETVLISLHSFFFAGMSSIIVSSSSLIHFSASFILLIPSTIFYFSYCIVHFCSLFL